MGGQEFVDPPLRAGLDHVAAAPGVLQEGQVPRLLLPQQELPVGGGAVDLPGAVALQTGQELAGAEKGDQDHRHAQAQGHVDALGQAEGGEHRQEGEGLRPGAALGARRRILGQRGVDGPPGEGHPLGGAGGAAGVGDHRGVLPAGGLRGDVHGVPLEVRPGQAVPSGLVPPLARPQLVPQGGGDVGAHGQDHEGLRRGLAPVSVNLCESRLQHQDHPGAGAGQGPRHVGGAGLHVHEVRHRADAVGGVDGGHGLRGIQGEDGHQVPRPHAMGAERRLRPADLVKEPAEGPGDLPAAQGGLFRSPLAQPEGDPKSGAHVTAG